MISALNAFRPDAVQVVPKSITVPQSTLTQMVAATAGALSRPSGARRLASFARVCAPCVVDASDACALYLASPVFVHVPPGATLERLIVAFSGPLPREHRPLVAHIVRLRAARVDIDVASGAFAVNLIRGLVAGAEGVGSVDIHVYGSAFTRSYVSSWLFQEAVRDPAIAFDSTWRLSASVSVRLEPLAYRPPLWACL